MKINIIEDARIIISNYDSKHCYFAWPTVARLRNGRIAVGVYKWGKKRKLQISGVFRSIRYLVPVVLAFGIGYIYGLLP